MAMKIGEYSYVDGAIQAYFGDSANIEIGKYTSIASNVTVFLGGNHRTDWISTFPFTPSQPGHPQSNGDIIIGNNVWIGFGVTIMSGVRIGDGAVVGARAVVVKDVDPYSIVAGNPAEFKRFRFPYEQVKELEKIKWWDWPEEEITKAVPLLQSGNVAKFIKYVKGLT